MVTKSDLVFTCGNPCSLGLNFNFYLTSQCHDQRKYGKAVCTWVALISNRLQSKKNWWLGCKLNFAMVPAGRMAIRTNTCWKHTEMPSNEMSDRPPETDHAMEVVLIIEVLQWIYIRTLLRTSPMKASAARDLFKLDEVHWAGLIGSLAAWRRNKGTSRAFTA